MTDPSDIASVARGLTKAKQSFYRTVVTGADNSFGRPGVDTIRALGLRINLRIASRVSRSRYTAAICSRVTTRNRSPLWLKTSYHSLSLIVLSVAIGYPSRAEQTTEHSSELGRAFGCFVTKVHDGDGPLWCANGIKVRIAGIQAPDFKSAEPCHRPAARRTAYVCDDAAAARAQRIVSGLTLHRSLTCQPVDRSYNRIVARCTLPDGRSLSCAAIAAGAATRWDRYWRKYGMGECR